MDFAYYYLNNQHNLDEKMTYLIDQTIPRSGKFVCMIKPRSIEEK